jgi:hypothetical protein
VFLVRDVFQLKFGKAREAMAILKEGLDVSRRVGFRDVPMRLLADVVGPYYTIVLESTFKTLAEYERLGQESMAKDEWKAWYQKFVPLVESGHREIFRVIE